MRLVGFKKEEDEPRKIVTVDVNTGEVLHEGEYAEDGALLIDPDEVFGKKAQDE